jgi:hypothetical protein
VERYAKQDPSGAGDAKDLVSASEVAALVGDVKVPVVVRIRAAEALLDRDEASEVAERLAALLDAKDQAARRPRLPWDFRYKVDGEARERRNAAQHIAAYFRERDDEEAQGRVFVEGAWYTAQRADDLRSKWEHAWELRTPHVRLRTDMEKKWADWYVKALEAEYAELVKLVGREPPASRLPLSVLVFKDSADFADFCNGHGYADKAAWDRFADPDRNVVFATFHKKNGLADVMGLFAKQYLQYATGRHWPVWFDEGRASWFGSADYATVNFDGVKLTVGIVGHSGATKELALAAIRDQMPPIVDVVAKDPRSLDQDRRRLWYVEAWALHAWLVDFAPEEVRRRFAEWQGVMEKLSVPKKDVDDVGFREFMQQFAKLLPDMDAEFREWAKKL